MMFFGNFWGSMLLFDWIKVKSNFCSIYHNNFSHKPYENYKKADFRHVSEKMNFFPNCKNLLKNTYSWFWEISVEIDIFVNFYIFGQFSLNGFPKLHMENNTSKKNLVK